MTKKNYVRKYVGRRGGTPTPARTSPDQAVNIHASGAGVRGFGPWQPRIGLGFEAWHVYKRPGLAWCGLVWPGVAWSGLVRVGLPGALRTYVRSSLGFPRLDRMVGGY